MVINMEQYNNSVWKEILSEERLVYALSMHEINPETTFKFTVPTNN